MSTYTEGQVHMLVDRLEAEGFTADHLTKLGQCSQLGDIRAFLEDKAEIVMKKVEKTIVSILTIVKTITTSVVPGKKTADCFTNKTRYSYRDSNLDSRLPEDQLAQIESKFSVQKLTQGAAFKQAVENFLGVTGDVALLAKEIKKCGCTTTLSTVEALIERQENREDVGLRIDGWANFFLVEDKAEDGQEPSVSVVYVDRSDRRWRVFVYRLDDGSVWYPEYRFFFRNKTL